MSNCSFYQVWTEYHVNGIIRSRPLKLVNCLFTPYLHKNLILFCLLKTIIHKKFEKACRLLKFMTSFLDLTFVCSKLQIVSCLITGNFCSVEKREQEITIALLIDSCSVIVSTSKLQDIQSRSAFDAVWQNTVFGQNEIL